MTLRIPVYTGVPHETAMTKDKVKIILHAGREGEESRCGVVGNFQRNSMKCFISSVINKCAANVLSLSLPLCAVLSSHTQCTFTACVCVLSGSN